MFVYIKDFKTFETINKMNLIQMKLADGEPGFLLVQRLNNEIYNEAWAVVNGEVFYIAGCTPDDKRLHLTIQHPLNAFTRPIPQPSETKYGAFIESALDTNYKNGGGDTFYSMPYLNVAQSDTTTVTGLEPDDYGYIVLSDVIADARTKNVDVAFSVSGSRSETLQCTITTKTLPTAQIIFGDGHHVLTAESYTDRVTSKATVIKPDGIVHYYLSADHHLSTTPPANRLPGKWNVYPEYSTDVSAEAVARGAFSHNTDSHRIEFLSDKEYVLNQPVRMRLNGSLYDTSISAVIREGDAQTLYKCGTLAIRLTEKLQELQGDKT